MKFEWEKKRHAFCATNELHAGGSGLTHKGKRLAPSSPEALIKAKKTGPERVLASLLTHVIGIKHKKFRI